jgi:hypothetical protein
VGRVREEKGKERCARIREEERVIFLVCLKREPIRYGRRFVMVYGAQPASASVYNLKANVIAEFGTGARNFASFSPGGHLITLAGFGSLKGMFEESLISLISLISSHLSSLSFSHSLISLICSSLV